MNTGLETQALPGILILSMRSSCPGFVGLCFERELGILGPVALNTGLALTEQVL